MAKLIKIDRNGSKHYEGMVTCDRCNGRGWFAIGSCNGQLVPSHVDEAVCYKCHGEGKVFSRWIERTPEYQAKLDAQRKARQEAKQAKLEVEAEARAQANSQKWLADNGFNADGQTWILLGDTFSKKDQIKEAGGKFNNILGWHINHQVEDSFMVSVADLAERSTNGWYDWKVSKVDVDKLKKVQAGDPESKHQGEVGQKITVTVKYIRSFTCEYRIHDGWWGTRTSYIHKFMDTSGNIFIWKSQNIVERVVDGECIRIPEGSELVLTGTVKDHGEYAGEKQTVLTRCKIK